MAGSPDLFWRTAVGACRLARSLDLDGIGPRVYLQMLPDEDSGYDVAAGKVTTVGGWPAVLLTMEDERITTPPADTETQQFVVPLRCWVAYKDFARKHDLLPVTLAAFKRLMDAFGDDDLVLQGVPELNGCEVVPYVTFDPRLPAYQHIVMGMTLRFNVQESRA